MDLKKENALLAISKAIRDTLSGMTNYQIERLMKSPLEEFRAKQS